MRVEHVRIAAAGVTASTTRRTLAGTVVTYGETGHTSIGPLKTKRGALSWHPDLSRIKLTREHDRGEVRGSAVELEETDDRLRVVFRVADGPAGDEALAEAGDPDDPGKPRIRDAFSYDVVNATVEDGWLLAGELIAVGQVGIPAYTNSRIDSVAATRKETAVTEDQRVRLAELRATQNPTAEQLAELAELAALEEQAGEAPAETPAPAVPVPTAAAASHAGAGLTVAASVPLVPGGAHRPPSRTSQRGALDNFVRTIVAALRPGGGGAAAITAALSDVTNSGAGANIEMPAWSGELWSGVAHEPEFTPLLNSGDLTSYEGKGWRFVAKPEIADYAGDKAAVPSAAVTTEPSTYEAARMAVGHDLDRKFYDFPNEEFLRAYVEAVRESWSIKLDGKVEAWIIANATDSTLSSTTVLGAVRKALRAVKRAKMGRATFVVVADEDFDTFDDSVTSDVVAALEFAGIDPRNWVSSDALTSGTVIAGNRLAATVRTLPGSPIRVSAQHIANGGIDEAFFGYYAIEEHNAAGIQKVTYDPTP